MVAWQQPEENNTKGFDMDYSSSHCVICNTEFRNTLPDQARKLIEDLVGWYPPTQLKEQLGWDCWNCSRGRNSSEASAPDPARDIRASLGRARRKGKILREGQPCRKCGTPVVRKEHKPDWRPKPGRSYWFRWWFECTNCKERYMVEAAKVLL
jgi:uncharacterized protein with PIN domain